VIIMCRNLRFDTLRVALALRMGRRTPYLYPVAKGARMTPLYRHAALTLLAFTLSCGPAWAQDALDAYLWNGRPLIIFADSDKDTRFTEQIAALNNEADALEERGVIVITDVATGGSRADRSELRKRFRPHGFTVILVAMDGEVALRRPMVVTADDITRLIDRTPMRQRELQRR
jgi:hypothetical protein